MNTTKNDSEVVVNTSTSTHLREFERTGGLTAIRKHFQLRKLSRATQIEINGEQWPCDYIHLPSGTGFRIVQTLDDRFDRGAAIPIFDMKTICAISRGNGFEALMEYMIKRRVYSYADGEILPPFAHKLMLRFSRQAERELEPTEKVTI
jgi:hypothetical protein